MGEYQFYEFRSIDRDLTSKEKKEVESWSSRTSVMNSSAVFIYHYGSFPKDEITAVDKYFDALFYCSNWGNTRLAFKFPKTALDIREIRKYCVPEFLAVKQTSKHIILDIFFSNEDDLGWVDGEGCLADLVPLRANIMNKDYRLLYLVWIQAKYLQSEWDEYDGTEKEPDIPAGLNKLNIALKKFATLFNIDADVLKVASEASTAIEDFTPQKYKTFIHKLSDKEKSDFLSRLLAGEAMLNIKLANRLRALSNNTNIDLQQKDKRNVKEIIKRIENIKRQAKEATIKKQVTEKAKKINEIESKEPDLWKAVYKKIAEKNAQGYDEAVLHLRELKELAIHKDTFDEYHKKLIKLQEKYSNLSALKRKLVDAKLLEVR